MITLKEKNPGVRITVPARWALCGLLTGCAAHSKPQAPPPSVAPSTQPTASLAIADAQMRPMYRELLPVDLPAVTRVATARSIDIKQAQERVAAAQGRYESSVEAVLPVIAPAFTFQHVEGVNQNANGTLAAANFNNLLPAITLQWIINPGAVVYDIVASKRRLAASREQAQATQLDALRTAAIQYYDLALTQAKVGVTRQAVAQAEEAMRLTGLRVRAGTALQSDEMRARAFLAGRRQDLLLAVNDFYQASVALTVTLDMDPTVTLVPSTGQLAQTTLVRDDLSIDELLGLAVQYRPDLRATRSLLAAVGADKKAVLWGALGPQLQAAYTYGGIKTRASGQTFDLQEQQKGSAGVGFALGLSVFGRTKIAQANQRSAALDAERQLIVLRSEVVAAQQASATSAAIIPIAQEQVQSAEESLRLAQANLKAGTLLLLDVLQSEDELDTARLRYAQAVARYNQSQVNLLAALGLLDSENVAAPAATLPTTNP
jgi:outer membrane protein TolC